MAPREPLERYCSEKERGKRERKPVALVALPERHSWPAAHGAARGFIYSSSNVPTYSPDYYGCSRGG